MGKGAAAYLINENLSRTIQWADEKFHLFADRLKDPLSYGNGHAFHFSAKDNLCSTEFQTRAGSKILEGYRPPFDATAIARLRQAGGLLVGKTAMDEFGFGSFGTNSASVIPRNPFDTSRSCGGSSSGAAATASVLKDHLALGVSTGGSISCPASFCGVIGFTPTYGRVSRWGLIDFGSSLDKIGLLSSSSDLVRKYFPIIAGPDPLDPTSQAQPPLDMGGDIKVVAIPEESLTNLSDEVRSSFEEALTILEDMGMEIRHISMPSLRFALPAYYFLSTAEASTNLARYCGMRIGVLNDNINQSFNDFFSQTRSQEFGDEAKRRILLGTFSRMVGFRDQYYLKALQVRQRIIHEYEKEFRSADAVLTPTMPFVAPRFEEIAHMSPLQLYQADALTVPPNLAGLPHLSLPCGYPGGLPVGMQIAAPHWMEGRLLELADRWGKTFQYRRPEMKA